MFFYLVIAGWGFLTKGKTLPTIGWHTSGEGVCVVDVGLL